jgi:hypothetical protein
MISYPGVMQSGSQIMARWSHLYGIDSYESADEAEKIFA